MAADDKPAKAPKADKGAAEKSPKGPKPEQGAKPDKAAAPTPGKGAKEAQGKGKQRDSKGEGKDKAAGRAARPKDYRPRMKTHYEKVVRDEMKKQFGYKNVMQIPRIDKIVLNMGVGEAVNDRKKVDSAAKDLGRIAGQ